MHVSIAIYSKCLASRQLADSLLRLPSLLYTCLVEFDRVEPYIFLSLQVMDAEIRLKQLMFSMIWK